MNRIPVGATVARAYGFAFGNIINNLGVIWIPVVILWTLAYFFQAQYMNAVFSMSSGDPLSALMGMRYALAAALAGFVLITAQLTALTKEALGMRTGSAFLQFPFGAAAWRLMGAYFLFGLVIFVIYVGCVFIAVFGGIAVAFAIGHSSDRTLTTALGLGTIALVAAILCGIVYAAIRLSFLLAPVAVVEKRVSLIRSWELTAGNFWRIFTVGLALFIPLLTVEGVYLYAAFGPGFFIPPHAHMTPQEIATFSEHQREVGTQMMLIAQTYWYIYYPVSLLVALILYGLYAGAVAHAYRALVPETPAEVAI